MQILDSVTGVRYSIPPIRAEVGVGHMEALTPDRADHVSGESGAFADTGLKSVRRINYLEGVS